MPGTHYTNQSSYLTPRVGRAGAVPNHHFRECEFSTPMPSTTCNFNALKCTDFPIPLNLNLNLNSNLVRTLAAHRGGAPDKMGKNGTNYDSHKIEPLRRSHLRRLPFAMSHFEFSIRHSSSTPPSFLHSCLINLSPRPKRLARSAPGVTTVSQLSQRFRRQPVCAHVGSAGQPRNVKKGDHV